ncbi:MAG TPA: L,D-transpeptidase family protein [Candidatus Acidoferrales bacterium]|nr:L,D-transpeptidase family protein [Candidatus Acidoferrales bacterium]
MKATALHSHGIRARGALLAGATILAIQLSSGVAWGASTPASSAAAPGVVAAPAANVPAQNHGELGALIESGSLADLRWPNFSDYRDWIAKFYGTSAYSFAWLRDDHPSAQALAMIAAFKDAGSKGLNPDDYDASRWDARVAKLQAAAPRASESDLTHFDLAMTVCAMRLISDLHVGRVNPQHFVFGLDVGSSKYDLADVLRNEVINSSNVDSAVAKVEPRYEGYQRAEAALVTYSKLAAAGDAPPVPVPPKGIRPGASYPDLAALATRLRQLGDLKPDVAIPTSGGTYQGAVVSALKNFQRRHGLEPDGVIGKGTVTELNRPLAYRVRQLQLTLERYRWIPPDFPEPPIVVNIPEFTLRTMRRQPAGYLSMRVVVGKAMRTQTPVFANDMRYVIFRPYWNVPPSIARAELVPKTRRDPSYLEQHGFEVVDRFGEVVSDGAVSDDVLDDLRSGALQIRQKPGPKNALGLVKFMFPNPYNVYLHSTPQPELFARARRDFSHGCIRVENPAALAAWVLRDKPEWTAERIQAAMNGDTTLQVNLNKPIPVLILYSTAVVEPGGEVRFFDDIYGNDKLLEQALAAGYPYPD